MNKLLIRFTCNTAGGGMPHSVTFIAIDRTGLWTAGHRTVTVDIRRPEDYKTDVHFVVAGRAARPGPHTTQWPPARIPLMSKALKDQVLGIKSDSAANRLRRFFSQHLGVILGITALMSITALYLNPPAIIVYAMLGLLPPIVIVVLLLARRQKDSPKREILFAAPTILFFVGVAAVFVYYSPNRLSARLTSLRAGLLPSNLLAVGQILPSVSQLQSNEIAQIENSVQKAEQLGIARSADLYLEAGLLNFSLKNLKVAETQFKKAIQLAMTYGSGETGAIAYNNLGVTLQRQDRVDESLKAFNSAVQTASDKETMFTAELNQAKTYRIKGRYDDAVAVADRILKTPELPHYWRASALTVKGFVAEDRRNYPEALQNYELAAKLYESQTALPELGRVYNYIGNVYSNWNRSDVDINEAIRNHELGLKLNQQVGNETGVADSYAGLAHDHLKKKDLDKALIYAQQSLEIYRRRELQVQESMVLDTIGDVYREKANIEKAISSYEQSLAIAREMGNRYAQAIILRNLGSIYITRHDCKRGGPLLLESQAIFEQIPRYEDAEKARSVYLKCAIREKS